MTDRVTFTCNGRVTEVDVEPGESLLSVLRERLGLVSVKDGCAPQGQCGCCTVLVDGDARVACVTPAARVEGRSVTTVEGLDPAVRDRCASAFVATGGSQCGFCTPGIVVRAVAARRPRARPGARRAPLPVHRLADGLRSASKARSERRRRVIWPRPRRAPSSRAASAQRVEPDVPLGGGGFADDTAPRDALVAVPLPAGFDADCVEAAGMRWVVGDVARSGARRGREGAGPAHDRRRRAAVAAAAAARTAACGSRRRGSSPRTSSPTRRGASPAASPRRRSRTAARSAARSTRARRTRARELADATSDRTVRVVYAREDVVRLGPKRPPIAATAVWRDGRVVIEGVAVAARARVRVAERVRRRRSTRSWDVGRRRRAAGRGRAAARSGSRSTPCSSKARSTRPVSTARR